MKFGFNYQKQEPEIELVEQGEVPYMGHCIYCGKETTLVLEEENVITLFIPICQKHYPKFKGKEKVVEGMVKVIKELILS
jgi:hypothetical protein